MKFSRFFTGSLLVIGLLVAALVFLMDTDGVQDKKGKLLKDLTITQAQTEVRAADAESIGRGKYLVKAADCYGCHGDPKNGGALSGGLGLDTPFGTFRTPNITPDKQYGIGAWSQAEFKAALRNGVGRKGEYLFPVFPYTSFTKLTDRDMEDIYAYLMSLPAVPAPDKPHKVKPPFGWRALLFFWRELFFTVGPIRTEPARGEDWNRGNYLVNAVTHCEECHTPRNFLGALKPNRSFSGNIGGPERQNATNITSDVKTGIGSWSIEDIQVLLKTGMTPESDLVGSAMKAVVRGTSKLTDADRHAMAVYLKSIPPIHVDLPPPKLASQSR
ncbi:MAG: c-type cytochrome [Gammaproteobacteria bacterium]|nr:c-type cytochrome [Gammaproteobacteria bacterium]